MKADVRSEMNCMRTDRESHESFPTRQSSLRLAQRVFHRWRCQLFQRGKAERLYEYPLEDHVVE